MALSPMKSPEKMGKKRQLPPRRVCQSCGRHYRGFTPECAACRTDGRENSEALSDLAREMRAKRRGVDVAELDNKDSTEGGQTSLPPGF